MANAMDLKAFYWVIAILWIYFFVTNTIVKIISKNAKIFSQRLNLIMFNKKQI
jgi:hypothetical protein